MKGIRIALIALLAAVLLAAPALALSLEAGAGEDFYVRDTAYVLSETTQEQIVAYNMILEERCDEAQLVVVTVSYLNEDTEIASLQLLNDWGVGSAVESNGMLLLLVANEGRGWLATGDGIDSVFTDRVADDYLNSYFWDYIDNGEFDQGVQTLTAALYDWYLDFYDVQDAGGVGYDGSDDYYDERLPQGVNKTMPYETNQGGAIMGWIVLIIIILIVWALVSSRRYRRMRGWGYTGSYWPVFWFGGRRYRDWRYRYAPPPAPRPRPAPRPGPGPRSGPGPGGPGPGPGSGSRPGGGYSSRPSGGGPRPSGGFSSRPSGGSSRPSGGGFRPSGGSFRGGGFGGHGGGGGGGRH